ncbi:MAG TPA: prepilin-type N-terminal cleavage/methylation domain-containing protein [Tepidisphaeraceae bacterium]|nr:prepilin-type N-terminal cleavage/methylation domain-containing protein [Tepidisphaeraceae bacterium]
MEAKSIVRRPSQDRHSVKPALRLVSCAFTLPELLVVLGIIVLLAGIILSMLSRVRAESQSVRCMTNLRGLSNAFLQYAADNGRILPNPSSASQSWEQVLNDAGYIVDPNILSCPADQEVYPSVGSSYDWRDTGDPNSTLAGQAISGPMTRSNPVLVYETLPGWHSKKKVNVAYLDGNTATLYQNDWLSDLETPIRSASGPTGNQ